MRKRRPGAPKKDFTRSIGSQNRTEHGSESANNEPTPSPQPALPAKSPETLKAGKKTYLARQECRDKLKLIFEIAAFFAVVGYATVTALQWSAMAKANLLTTQNFKLAQLPHVSLGKKDGTIAEFAVPKSGDPTAPVGIKIYLQNGGQSDALNISVGIVTTMVLNGRGVPQSPHPFQQQRDIPESLLRYKTANGGWGWTGGNSIGGSIAPQSEYVHFSPGQVSMEQYESILEGKRSPLVMGRFEYCDQFGDYSCRDFELFWQGPPFNAFVEINESDCAFMYSYPPNTIPGETYLLPCEQPDERDARQGQERTELLKKAAAASPAPSAKPTASK